MGLVNVKFIIHLIQSWITMTTILLINQPLISSVTIIKEEAAIQKNLVLCHQFTDNPTFTVLLLLVHQSYTRKDNGLNIKRIRKYDSTLSCFILSDRLRYWHASESRINGDMMEIQDTTTSTRDIGAVSRCQPVALSFIPRHNFTRVIYDHIREQLLYESSFSCLSKSGVAQWITVLFSKNYLSNLIRDGGKCNFHL